MNLYQIENKIEELRELLNNSGAHYTSSEMVTLSQELDAYITAYQKMNHVGSGLNYSLISPQNSE